jgi:TPR repeat protein
MDKELMKARTELQELAERGSVWNHIFRGRIFSCGLGTGVDASRAENHFRKAYAAGLDEGLYQPGRFYLDNRDHDKAEEIFSAGVSPDYPPAPYWLAKGYEVRPGESDRLEEIFSWSERASARGGKSCPNVVIQIPERPDVGPA